jgi:hypothetical protein
MDKAIAIARKVEGIKLIKNDMRTCGTGYYRTMDRLQFE